MKCFNFIITVVFDISNSIEKITRTKYVKKENNCYHILIQVMAEIIRVKRVLSRKNLMY